MEPSDPKETVATSRLTKELFSHSLILLLIALSGPILLIYQFYRLRQIVELPPLGILILPIVSTFAISILASLALVRRVTIPLTKRIRVQFHRLGYVEDNRDSLFSNFGFNLLFGVTIGFSIIGFFLCPEFLLKAATIDIGNATTSFFRCQTWDYSVTAFLAGIGIAYSLWMLFQLRLIEKENNQKILIHHYKTRESPFRIILIAAVVVYLVVQGFYQLITLGSP